MSTSTRSHTSLLRGVTAAALAVSVAAGLTACGDSAEYERDGTLLVVATATANEARPALPDSLDGVLRSAVESGEGSLTVLVPKNGAVEPAGDRIDVVVKRGNEVEKDPSQIEKGLIPIRETVDRRLSGLASNSESLDLLAGLNDAARRAGNSTIVALSSGLQTEGVADFAGLGFEFDNDEVIDKLRDAGFLPDLSGRRVYFSGLGAVAGKQQALPEPMIRKVTDFWLDLCQAAKATKCETVAGPEKVAVSASTTPAKTVPVPTFAIPALSGSTKEITIDSSALFTPDSADMLPGTGDKLRTLATRINALGKPVTITGHAWKWGPADGARDLSERRAKAVADALAAGGLKAGLVTKVHGVGYDQLIDVPGADEPTVAAANRVVVIGLD